MLVSLMMTQADVMMDHATIFYHVDVKCQYLMTIALQQRSCISKGIDSNLHFKPIWADQQWTRFECQMLLPCGHSASEEERRQQRH